MNSSMNSTFLGAIVILIALSFPASLVHAEHQKTVDGIIVNVGVIPAGKALDFPGETPTHDNRLPRGAQHLVVSLSDAQVTVEVKDPRGNVERKVLVSASASGVPDYSGIFNFGYSGKYAIRVVAVLKGSKRQLKANFTWTHVIT